MGVPAAEADVAAPLVRSLLLDQHPDLAALPLVPADSGWDNVMYRLGEHLAIRMPRRAAALPTHEAERRWLPVLAPRLPLTVPAAVRTGRPGCGYPWTWSVVPWLDGVSADQAPADASQVPVLAGFVSALHVAAPADAPINPFRSLPLSDRDAQLRERWDHLEDRGVAVPAAVRRVWTDGLCATVDVEPTWIHGDLHARNIVVRGGALSGVIDWGDVAKGDRATDLASIWMLFEAPEVRAAALAACGASEATSARARAWAVYFAILFAHAGLADDDARHARLGAAILARVATGP